MKVVVRVPESLSVWFDNNDEAYCRSGTIGDCFEQLEKQYPGFKKRLFDNNNKLSATAVFLNGDNIQHLQGLETIVNDTDELAIIPLAAGG